MNLRPAPALMLALLMLSCTGNSRQDPAATRGGEPWSDQRQPEIDLRSQTAYVDMEHRAIITDTAVSDTVTLEMADQPFGGFFTYRLVRQGKNRYREVTPPMDAPDIGYGSTWYLGKIGNETKLVCRSGLTGHILFTLTGCDHYDAYRERCYMRLLAGRYKAGKQTRVQFNPDKTLKGLREAPAGTTFSFARDAFGQIAPISRSDYDGRHYMFEHAAECPLVIYATRLHPTDGLIIDRAIYYLHRDGTAETPWLHSEAIDWASLMYYFPRDLKRMLAQLQGVKQPDETQQWNLALLEAYKATYPDYFN